MILNDLMRAAEEKLAAVGVENPRRDVQILIANLLECEPSRLILMGDEEISQAHVARFAAMVEARRLRQPVSQIIGYREFWGRRLKVTPDVLDPRPDTETLIEEALKEPAPKRFLDLCTGSGNIAVTLLSEWPGSFCVATDISPSALKVASENARSFGVENRLELRTTSWLENVGTGYELVVSNPPYIPGGEILELAPEVRDWEPRIALSPGEDGLEPYRLIAAGLEGILAPSGRAILEFGYDQADAVSVIFHAEGYRDTQIIHDLAGHARIISIANKF